MAFGVLASTSGLSVPQAGALSLLTFTGASQFALVSIVAGGGSVVAGLGSALLLAARNGVYGVTVGPLLPRRRSARLAASHLVIDETTAMATAQPDEHRAREAFFATGISLFLCWNLGTFLGATGGSQLADPSAFGLDAAFAAGFLALLLPHLRTAPGRAAALAGAAIAAGGLPVLPNGAAVLASALGVGAGAWVLARQGGRP